MSTTTYVRPANTAKLVRQALAGAFPGVAFRVRTKTYSGGASITVSWVDGPTSAQVAHITHQYQGKGLIDHTDYAPDVDRVINGRRVHYGADYIHTRRAYSVAFAQRTADAVADRRGLSRITVTERDGEAWIAYGLAECASIDGWMPLRDLILRALDDTAA